MKKSLNFGMLLMFAFSLMSSMCSSDDEPSNNNLAAEIEQIVTEAQDGSWRITYYFDSNQEETNDYVGYSFIFGSNNMLTAANGNNDIVGSWSVTNTSNSNDDSSSDDDVDFNISFNAPEKFQELSDDWDVISHSSTKIELIDISGGNGGTDYLTFEKE